MYNNFYSNKLFNFNIIMIILDCEFEKKMFNINMKINLNYYVIS